MSSVIGPNEEAIITEKQDTEETTEIESNVGGLSSFDSPEKFLGESHEKSSLWLLTLCSSPVVSFFFPPSSHLSLSLTVSATSKVVVSVCIMPLGSFPLSLSLFQSFGPRNLQSIDYVLALGSICESTWQVQKVMWLQGGQFEKSTKLLASIYCFWHYSSDANNGVQLSCIFYKWGDKECSASEQEFINLECTWMQEALFEKSKEQLVCIYFGSALVSLDGLQLDGILFPQQKHLIIMSDTFMGLEDSSKQKSPITLHLGYVFSMGFLNNRLLQGVSFLSFYPTQVVLQIWFRGKLIEMLYGRICSLSRKKRRTCAHQY